MPAARHAFPVVAAIAVLTLTAGAAHAQGSDLSPGDYQVRRGAGVLIGPAYPGSETTEASPVPILDVGGVHPVRPDTRLGLLSAGR
jgi:outer membrane scaffolding protein for murein synthesis (MipA/OmpV family)